MVTNPNIAPDPSPGRFNSALPLQFSVDTRIMRRTVGWVLGSPETKPLKRYVVIAVCRLTKRPSKRDLLTAWKDRHHGNVAHVERL